MFCTAMKGLLSKDLICYFFHKGPRVFVLQLYVVISIFLTIAQSSL